MTCSASSVKHLVKPLIAFSGRALRSTVMFRPRNWALVTSCNQLQAYKDDIPDLERFMAWRTIDGHEIDPLGEMREMETLVHGAFQRDLLLDYDAIVALRPEWHDPDPEKVPSRSS